MREGGLLGCETTRGEFERVFFTYLEITFAYANKLAPLCVVPDGLSGQWADELEYPLRTFETVGILGVLAATMKHIADVAHGSQQETFEDNARDVARLLAALIDTNPSAATPRFDATPSTSRSGCSR